MKHAAAFFAESFPFVNELLTKRLRLVVALGVLLVLAVNLAAFIAEVAASRDHVTPHGQIVGGDFIVFDTAADAARAGEETAIYDAEGFYERLGERFPEIATPRIAWLYPPTMLFFIFPLALAPYLASYFLWSAAGLGLLIFAVRTVSKDRLALLAVIAAPAVFQTLITGQTAFFTTALIIIAAGFADRRAILAGVAAGLLTVKPQLGILIPLAFAAAGCWRAFASAAVTALLLAAASAAVFGLDAWAAFPGAVAHHSSHMQTALFPYEKLVSVFGGAALLGVPVKIALGLQTLVTLSLAAFAALGWRRVKDPELRMAILCAAAPLATPYAFYYEMTLMLPALLVIAKRGAESGWLPGERIGIAVLWLAPMFVLALGGGLPWGPAAMLGVLALVARRIMLTPGATAAA